MSTAVVKSTECPFREAARPRAIDRWVLPRPTLPIRTMLVWVAMKARRNRFWICGRLIFLGQLHWKSSRDLSTGKRAFLSRTHRSAELVGRPGDCRQPRFHRTVGGCAYCIRRQDLEL